MLTGRNVVFATVAIAIVSLLAATLSLTATGDHELGRNTFGVRAHGQRGLYETLDELNINVQRAVAPPSELLATETTIAFLGPDRTLVEMEPEHLMAVAKWVNSGGTVLYAPAKTSSARPRRPRRRAGNDSDADAIAPRKTFWQLMGIPEVKLTSIDVVDASSDGGVELRRASSLPRRRDPGLDEAIESVISPKDRPIAKLNVHATGVWERLPGSPVTFAVPQHGVQLMKADETWPTASEGGLVIRSLGDGPDYWLAASFPVGSGSVMVLSDPVLAENGLIAREDNAVLIVALLTEGSRRIVFDEFYHGLTARGNPLVLLQRPGFTLLLSFICLTMAIFAWRHGQRLGPAMSVRSAPRRSLLEYVDAMARLFVKGRDRNTFLARENRDGLTWMLQQELRLPPSKHASDEIHARLARRDPRRAESYRACLNQLDQILNQPRPDDRDVLDAMKKVTDCL